MEDTVRAEMEEGGREEDAFIRAGCCERFVLCASRMVSLKKYCLLSLLLVLILTVQLVSLFPPSDLGRSEVVKEGADMVASGWKKFFGKQVALVCVAPENATEESGNSTSF